MLRTMNTVTCHNMYCYQETCYYLIGPELTDKDLDLLSSWFASHQCQHHVNRLTVGILLLANISQMKTCRYFQVSHILNVAYGVENVFPDLFIYKTVSIQDHPDADLLQHVPDCCDFIQQARSEVTHP